METPLRWVFASLFGCHHRKLSRVFTIQRRTYQVCFECGREFEYSWAKMHPLQSNVTVAAYAPLEGVSQVETSTV